jgi:hypothetical protein
VCPCLCTERERSMLHERARTAFFREEMFSVRQGLPTKNPLGYMYACMHGFSGQIGPSCKSVCHGLLFRDMLNVEPKLGGAGRTASPRSRAQRPRHAGEAVRGIPRKESYPQSRIPRERSPTRMSLILGRGDRPSPTSQFDGVFFCCCRQAE